MLSNFYLASHDYVSSPSPRKCKLLQIVKGNENKQYFFVEIIPPLPKEIFNRQKDVECLLLKCCNQNDSFLDIGNKPIMVDIYLSDFSPTSDIDDINIERIGVGTLHSSLGEALKYSPIDEREKNHKRVES